MRTSMRSMSCLATNPIVVYHAEESSAAWNVPTMGHVASMTAAIATTGVQGSCTCSTSNFMCLTARSMRNATRGSEFT